MEFPLLRAPARVRLPLVLALALALAPACTTVGQDPSPVTPQRPTFSQDTHTTAPGTFEVEAGLTIDPGDYFDTPTVLKYGYDEKTEVSLGFSLYKSIDTGGRDDDGFGDLVLGVRHRFYEDPDKHQSAAIRFATKLPTADEDDGLGTGEVDFFMGGSYTKELDQIDLTGYYELGVLGDPGSNDTNILNGFACQAVIPIQERLDLFGELALLFVDGADDISFTTWGGQYHVAESFVIDAAVVLGINDDAPDFQLLGGITTNLGPVFD